MSRISEQPGLFDRELGFEHRHASAGRARMRGTIERLSGLSVPPWKDQMEEILENGAFRRAMQLVPDEEAQALWAEFDVQMDRLCAIWAAADPVGGEGI